MFEYDTDYDPDPDSQADAMMMRYGYFGSNKHVEQIQNALNDDDEDGDGDSDDSGDDTEQVQPTHRCASCRDQDEHIESAPRKTYQWCDQCDGVMKFIPLDSKLLD